MKAILLLLLTCLPLWAATTYPMLSDTTNRTVTGGVTNLSFLNSNSVFTGTARWMGIATLTNTGNIFVGDGSGLTGVGMVTSGGLATNATIYGLTVATGQTNTHLTASSIVTTDANKGIVSGTTTANLATLSANQTFTGSNNFNGELLKSNYPLYATRILLATNVGFFSTIVPVAVNYTSVAVSNGLKDCTMVFQLAIPALKTNSVLGVSFVQLECTNSNGGQLFYAFYGGAATNYITGLNGTGTAGQVAQGSSFNRSFSAVAPTLIFANEGSFTNQYALNTFPISTIGSGMPAFKVDTSTNGWPLMMGVACQTGGVNFTNWNLVRIAVIAYEYP